MKVVKIETPLFAESASPMFASTPVSEALSVVIDTSVLQAVEELHAGLQRSFSQQEKSAGFPMGSDPIANSVEPCC